MGVGAGDVMGFHLWHRQPLDRVNAPMAGKPAPSSHEPPHQWNLAPIILIYQWKEKGGEGVRGMGVKE